MLVEAFRGLDRLETINLRDFNAWRSRDQTSWKSWGSQSVYEETGRWPQRYTLSPKQQEFTGQLFSTLIYALGLAGRRTPRLEVPLTFFNAYLPDDSFRLSDALFPAVGHVLLNLEVLHLAVAMTRSGLIGAVSLDSEPVPAKLLASRFLRHFLNCTPNLKHLRLNFNRDTEMENICFLEWLAAASDSAGILPQPYRTTVAGPSPVGLSQLVTLELGHLDLDPTTLISVIRKFALRLERISLRWICLRLDSVNRDAEDRSWAVFFDDLVSIGLPSLRYFCLDRPMIRNFFGGRGTRLQLDVRGITTTWKYVDQDLSGFFHTLGEELVYLRPRPKPKPIAALVSSIDSVIDSEIDSEIESDYESD
jgi:hypothetical protein